MQEFKLLGLFSVIPATIFLTLSFFVLFTLRKIEIKGLQAFGYVIVALLWLSAALFLSCGIYVLVTGRHPLCMPKPHKMMMQQMQPMMEGSMQHFKTKP